ncbi:MAG: transglutaminase domain-containing protein [Aristaeellaceae bacterium]
MIGDMNALMACLAETQSHRAAEVRCQLTPALSAQLTDAALTEALVIGLPMAQGVQPRILRSRGQGVSLTAKVRYRQGVRMLDSLRDARVLLTQAEHAGLDIARSIATKAMSQAEKETRFRLLYGWVCRNIRYAHTSPGAKDYERLVGAASVLADGQANCQGFADVLYLLCGLCGIEAGFRCGRGEKRLHVWNRVRLNGEWQEVDVSRDARAFRAGTE